MNDQRESLAEWREAVCSAYERVVVLRVALALFSAFGRDGEVRISRETLADQAGVASRTVRNVIVTLEADGWLTVTPPEENGDGLPNLFGFRLPDSFNTMAPPDEPTGPSTQGEGFSEAEDTPAVEVGQDG